MAKHFCICLDNTESALCKDGRRHCQQCDKMRTVEFGIDDSGSLPPKSYCCGVSRPRPDALMPTAEMSMAARFGFLGADVSIFFFFVFNKTADTKQPSGNMGERYLAVAETVRNCKISAAQNKIPSGFLSHLCKNAGCLL
jgi:hypothetical protein